MNRIIIASIMLLAGFSNLAIAVCPPSRQYVKLTASQIISMLTAANTYACGTNGNQVWNEFLQGGATGNVFDYKQGPGHPIDPLEQVGTYLIDRFSNITYNYGAGGTYQYTIWTLPPIPTPIPLPKNVVYCGTTPASPEQLSIRVSNSPVPCP